VDPITTIDSFGGVIAAGLVFQVLAYLMIGANNRCLMTLSFSALSFQIFLPAVAILGVALWVSGIINGDAASGMLVLGLIDVVIGAPLTILHYRKDPEYYLEIKQSIGRREAS
jgi:hypothetical protein